MIEKKIFEADYESNCNIMFLVKRNNKIRLMSYKNNPWRNTENDDNEYRAQDSLYLFKGILGQHEKSGGKKKDKNNTNFIKLKDARRFDSDKIQVVELLSKIVGKQQ